MCGCLFNKLSSQPVWRDWLIKYDFITREEPEVTYKIGDIFKHEDGEHYVLAQVSRWLVRLIGFDGNRFHDSERIVGNVLKITEAEFKDITMNKVSEFTQVKPEDVFIKGVY